MKNYESIVLVVSLLDIGGYADPVIERHIARIEERLILDDPVDNTLLHVPDGWKRVRTNRRVGVGLLDVATVIEWWDVAEHFGKVSGQWAVDWKQGKVCTGKQAVTCSNSYVREPCGLFSLSFSPF